MLTPEQQQIACQKLIQKYMDDCKFGVPDDAGKALGTLLMLTTMALNSIMGDEYTMRTILKVAEEMESGKPQERVKLEVIDRSKFN